MKNLLRARALSRTLAASGLALALAAGLTAGLAAGAEAGPGTEAVARAHRGVSHYPRPLARPLTSLLGAPVARPEGEPDYTFLSAPDFMNSDLADVRGLARWHRGLPNSWNSSYARTLRTIMRTFQAEHPDDVFVAGDLVQGHWGEPGDRTGIFGPARTVRQRSAALERAADFYFSRWRRTFAAAGLPVYAAVGDHDIGDNPWSGHHNAFKRRHVRDFKSAFHRNVMARAGLTNRPSGPAHGTAYATYVDPQVLLVTVDVFRKTRRGVVTELDPQQLRWLRGVLAAANERGTDWIIVQGHTPVITPVRTYGSSALSYRGGTGSAFWRTLVENRVDIYLNGEVHDVSVERAGGVTQISHGGTVKMATASGRGATNFALGEIFGDTMFLRDNRFTPRLVDESRDLWQVGRSHRPAVRKEVWDHPLAIGHLVLTSDNQLLYTDGAFNLYRG